MGIYNLGGGGGAPELQAKEATPLITNAQQIILPDEGYDGLSKVTVNPMPTGALKTPTVNSIGYVSSGVQTAGYLGTSATSGLQLSTQAAKTITPTTYSQTAVARGKYATGDVIVSGDSNLVANNIAMGTTLFGINGTAYVAQPIFLNDPSHLSQALNFINYANPSYASQIQFPAFGTLAIGGLGIQNEFFGSATGSNTITLVVFMPTSDLTLLSNREDGVVASAIIHVEASVPFFTTIGIKISSSDTSHIKITNIDTRYSFSSGNWYGSATLYRVS